MKTMHRGMEDVGDRSSIGKSMDFFPNLSAFHKGGMDKKWNSPFGLFLMFCPSDVGTLTTLENGPVLTHVSHYGILDNVNNLRLLSGLMYIP